MKNEIYFRLYLAGYDGWILPRLFRKVMAGSGPHRAWFLGYTGHFVQDGIRYGLFNPYKP